jgi:hypothetical protein
MTRIKPHEALAPSAFSVTPLPSRRSSSPSLCIPCTETLAGRNPSIFSNEMSANKVVPGSVAIAVGSVSVSSTSTCKESHRGSCNRRRRSFTLSGRPSLRRAIAAARSFLHTHRRVARVEGELYFLLDIFLLLLAP